jgi:hypothetical protein
MKKYFSRSIFKISFVQCSVLFFSSCSDVSPEVSKPYRARILSFASADNQEKSVKYSLETKQYNTLENLMSLEGKYFSFVSGGELVIKSVEGSKVESDKFTGGSSPHLRYTVEDGVIVPRDYQTLILLSAFHEFEQVFENLESLTGVTPQKFIEKNGPLKIMFEPKLAIDSDGSKIDATIKLNAAFVPGKNQFILFRRSNVENVPLAGNLQVIAHELGHSLFERSFYNGTYEACNADESSNDRYFKGRYSGEYAISGLNEGFADVVSWAMTGSTDILRSSIDIKEYANERDFARVKFNFSDLGFTSSPSGTSPSGTSPSDTGAGIVNGGTSKCDGSFYCIGTLFAKSVREAAVAQGVKTTDKASRRAVLKDVFKAVTGVQDVLKQVDNQILPAPTEAVKNCQRSQGNPSLYDGQITGAFLYAFLNGIEAAKRPTYCSAFQTHFGNNGFPESVRGLCK